MNTDEPEAYIVGWQPFVGLKIHLDSKPLIPRAETEWWTDQILNNVVHQKSYMKFLDLCAGSGAIGCAALSRLPNTQVYFGEIDEKHKATILKNIRENNLDESRIHICIGDLFEPFGDMTFDIIAVNPPYIPAGRKLPRSVAEYEPAIALYAGNDGLDVTRRIAAELPKRLAANGEAWIECDSPNIEAALALFTAQGLSAEIRTDQYGNPRVIYAKSEL